MNNTTLNPLPTGVKRQDRAGLKFWMTETRHSYRTLMEDTNLSVSTLFDIAQGRTWPHASTLKLLIDALNKRLPTACQIAEYNILLKDELPKDDL